MQPLAYKQCALETREFASCEVMPILKQVHLPEPSDGLWLPIHLPCHPMGRCETISVETFRNGVEQGNHRMLMVDFA